MRPTAEICHSTVTNCHSTVTASNTGVTNSKKPQIDELSSAIYTLIAVIIIDYKREFYRGIIVTTSSEGKPMKKVVENTRTKIIDVKTGEVISDLTEITTTDRRPQEPPYVKMYIEDLGKIYEITQGRRDILFEIVKHMDYEGYVNLSKPIRTRIVQRLGITDGSIRNATSEYVKKGLLIKLGGGTYEVNAKLFGKGSWENIYKRRCELEMTVTYSSSGRKITTKIKPSKSVLKAVS